jgi:hypothetical protein
MPRKMTVRPRSLAVCCVRAVWLSGRRVRLLRSRGDPFARFDGGRGLAHLSAFDDFSAGVRALGRLTKPR